MDFIRSLRLEEKLSPRKNVDIIWFYIFFISLVAYLYILSDFINSKPFIGRIDVLDESFNKLIYPSHRMEIIAEGLQWAEGPLWIQDDQASLSHLMFSDTIKNRIYKWEEGKGLFTVGKTIYVEKSGCSTDPEYCDSKFEPGSNGLLRYSESNLDLIVCQHGERAVTLLREDGGRQTIASHYKDLRLNSPNDLLLSPDGHLYFTDPSYGLVSKDSLEIVDKELNHSGVYFIHAGHVQQAIADGTATNSSMVMDATMTSPNGLAFSPDYSKLYVSNSAIDDAYIKVFDVLDSGALTRSRVFYNMTDLYQQHCSTVSKCDGKTNVGVPDGLKVDINGNIFATGPGGVLVLSPAGELIGRFNLDRPVSNLVFGADGRLYFTAEDLIVRVWIKTKPVRFISKVPTPKKQGFW